MMLQIDWWGGLLIIWGVGCYWLLMKIHYTHKWSVDALSTHAGFVAAALLVLGWFHPLPTKVLQQAYLGVFGVMVLALPLLLLWPAPDLAALEREADDDEELSPLWSVLGQALFLGPVIIAAVLGGFKCWQLARSFGWLA